VDGRYGVFLAPLVIVVLAGAVAGPVLRVEEVAEHAQFRLSPLSRGGHDVLVAPRRQSAPLTSATLIGVSALVACSALLTAAAAHETAGVPANPAHFFSSWSDPDAPARAVVAAMEAHHLRDAYGDYWTAYVLDFLAPGRLSVSPSALDDVRWPQLAARVGAAKKAAWLFFSPADAVLAAQVFANPSPGPGGYSLSSFEALLGSEHVSYHVVDLGVLDAVVPDAAVRLVPPSAG